MAEMTQAWNYGLIEGCSIYESLDVVSTSRSYESTIGETAKPITRWPILTSASPP